ncbi:uncharacterized protein LOC141929225 [Strix aluco]|uniref:uncharacterized protein LOC141929225 n=1 Tax=Strix aluco TaxID=111821 RepID=UPI003DA26AE4
MLRSVPGLPAASEPAQLPPITYQLPQASVWQGGPGPMGAPGQLVQLHPGMWLPPMVQLPPGVQFCSMAAPCPPAHGWGQQVVGRTLVPPQPMGLGPGAVVQEEPLYPTGSCLLHVPARPSPPSPCHPAAQRWVQGPPLLHNTPGSAQKLPEASNMEAVAVEDSVPAASAHQPALAPLTGRATIKPKAAVTALAAPGKPADLPEQGLDAFAEAFREEAEDTTAQQILAWLNTVDGEDTIPDVLDSPSVTAFLQQLPDVSAYVAEGSSPKEQAVAARLGDSEDAVSDVPELTALLGELPDLSSLTSTMCCDELPDLSVYVVDGDCPQDRAMVAHLGDSGDTVLTASVPNLPAEVLKELPDLCRAEGGCDNEQVAVVMLVDGENIFPDSLSSTVSSNEAPNFLGYGTQGNWAKDHLSAAMLGDADPFWGVPASPSQDPTGQQGRMAAELPTWLPPSPSETSEESSEESSDESSDESSEDSPAKRPQKGPLKALPDSHLLSPQGIPLLSPLPSPSRPSRRHPPRTARLMEEVLRRQPRVLLTRLPLENALKGPQETPLPSRSRPSRNHPAHTARLMEEVLRRQPRVLLTRLPLPLGAVSGRGVPGSGRAGGKGAKCPAPARSAKKRETSLRDNIPPKRRKMVV